MKGRPQARARRGVRPVMVLEVLALDADGTPQARPAQWDDAAPPPRIVLGSGRPGAPAPGVGDRVLARLRREPDGSYRGQPMRLLDSGPRRVLGLFHADDRGGGFIRPADRRARHDFAVGADDTAGARPGELVMGEARRERRRGLPAARVTERLGAMEAPGAISLLAIRDHGLPDRFPPEALAEAERLAAPGPDGRSDLRALPLVTIDGADARDFDDAVWAAPDSAPDNAGGWRAVVAIADVAYFVRPGGALDRAARERGNSAYFPDRVVPMLPAALSTDLCSLKPGVDRACVAAHLRIGADGALRDWRFERALMRSAARLTYASVQAAAEGRADGGGIAEPVRAALPPLYGAHRSLRAARERRGALELDLPERAVSLAADGKVARIGFAPRYESHRLIEEFMIAANVAAAAALEAARTPCMYRVHDRPEMAKLEALRGFLDGIGIALPQRREVRAAAFNDVLAALAPTRNADVGNLMVLRSQAQAAYSPDNIGHFGLGLARYAHFTSPIRRYADLLVHRALLAAFALGPGGMAGERDALAGLGAHLSATERRAQAAERDAGDRYAAAWLADRVGAEFDGRIVAVTRFGVFVRLEGSGAEGLVPGRTLGAGRPRFDARRLTLEAGARTLRLGDPVRVALQEADPVAGGLTFSLCAADGAPWPAGPPGPPGRRRRRQPA